MKVAQFKSIEHAYTCVMHWPEWAADRRDYETEGYVRLSEWAEVEFLPLSTEQIVSQQIAGLDGMRAQVVKEFSGKLKEIDDRKAELLALTHEATPEALA